MAGIGAGRLLGSALCGVFLPPPIPHHVRGHLKKLHLKMRGVFLQFPPRPQKASEKNSVWKCVVFFCPLRFHTTSAHLEKSRREKSCADPLKTYPHTGAITTESQRG